MYSCVDPVGCVFFEYHTYMSVPLLQCSGVNDIYEYNELHLDSAGRDQGDNNHPIFVLQPAIGNVMGIKLLSAQIPFSYYVFNSANNTFLLQPDYADPTKVTVTLPPGNYNVDTFIPVLTTALETANALDTYTVDYSNLTGRYTVTSNGGRQFALHFGSGVDDIGESNPRIWMGFGPGANVSSSGGVLTAPATASITGPNYIYLTTSFGGRLSRNIRVNGNSSIDPTTIAKIPVTVNPWGLITYTDPTASYAFDMSLGQVQNVEMGLQFGHTSQAVDMNGAPWSIVLQILTQRENTASRRMVGEMKAGQTSNKRIRVR